MNDITKTGLVNFNCFNEYLIEPDGSVWEHVFHHNNPSVNLFASTDDFTNGVYKSPDMWFNMLPCKTLSSWEFLYVQKDTVNGTPRKYRWVQTVSPFGTSYSAVQPSAVTRITTTGYTDGGYGGLYNAGDSAYMVVADSTSGHWFGATGCWTAYNGGIPGYPNSTCTTGCIDIYVRVTNKQCKIYKNGLVNPNEIIEY